MKPGYKTTAKSDDREASFRRFMVYTKPGAWSKYWLGRDSADAWKLLNS